MNVWTRRELAHAGAVIGGALVYLAFYAALVGFLWFLAAGTYPWS